MTRCLSPARHEHVSPHAKYSFEPDEDLSETQLRPLHQARQPSD